MSLEILGIGTATPVHSISQAEAAASAKLLCCRNEKEERFLDHLYSRTKIQKRGSVLLTAGKEDPPRPSFYSLSKEGERGPGTEARMERYALESVPLAAQASRRALKTAGIDGRRITQLITVSCTGFSAPGIDIALIKELGLPPALGRTQVGFMGCHGALNGLRIARAFVEADPAARVLLTSLELCSLHLFCGWDPEKIVANGLFADGAAALVGGPRSQNGSPAWKLVDSGSFVFPDSREAMTWDIGNYGFEMTLSARVPELVREALRPWVETWLAQNRLTIGEIGSWAVHPGGPKILETVREALGLRAEDLAVSEQILLECGNMSSATTLFIVQRLIQKKAPLPCVALGFGPGLAAEAALFQ